jgi:hypothetical protein
MGMTRAALPLVAFRPAPHRPDAALETVDGHPVAQHVHPDYAALLAVGPEAVNALRTVKTEMEGRFSARSLAP